MKKKKGISIFISLVMLVFIFGMGAGLMSVAVNQIRTFAGMGNSVAAFYAADTGIEKALALFRISRHDCATDNGCVGELPNGSVYGVQELLLSSCSEYATPQEYCFKSVGAYGGTSRAIEAKQ